MTGIKISPTNRKYLGIFFIYSWQIILIPNYGISTDRTVETHI